MPKLISSRVVSLYTPKKSLTFLIWQTFCHCLLKFSIGFWIISNSENYQVFAWRVRNLGTLSMLTVFGKRNVNKVCILYSWNVWRTKRTIYKQQYFKTKLELNLWLLISVSHLIDSVWWIIWIFKQMFILYCLIEIWQHATYKNTDKRATSIHYVHKLMVEQSLYTVTVQCKGNSLWSLF